MINRNMEENMAEDRHLWSLGVDEQLLAVQILIIIVKNKTAILLIVLYGYETRSYRLRLFENRILRRKFGHKWDENGEWRRLHNEELHNLYRSLYIVRVTKSRKWAGQIVGMEEGRSAFKILTGKLIGKNLDGLGIDGR